MPTCTMRVPSLRHEKSRGEGIAEGIEKGKEEGIAEGIEKGKEEGIKQVALNLLSKGQNPDSVSQATGLSKEEVDKLRRYT